MANTTNLSLVKLGGTEKLKNYPTSQASNMDTIDTAFGAGFGVSSKPTVNASINNLADGLAIISNNNTHAAITSGQFVYVRNHGSLSEGLYVATSNISANGTLSGSNLTADTNGGLNTLSNNLADVKSLTSEGSFSTFAELETILNNLVSGMEANTIKTFSVTATANVFPFVNTYIYSCVLYKKTSNGNYSHVMMYPNAALKPITGLRSSSTSWSYESITINSELNNLATEHTYHFKRKSFTNKTCTFTFNNYAAGIFIVFAYTTNSIGVYVLARSNTTLLKKAIIEGSNISITLDDSTVTFTDTSSTTHVLWMPITDGLSD